MKSTALTVIAVTFALATLLPHPSTAQLEESNTPTAEDKEKEYRGPLPFYFGKLGLSERQKVKLYEIQESYEERIAELEKQIEELEAQQEKSMETQLTPGQKLRLKELREEARLERERAEQAEQAEAASGEKPAAN